jgi:hypothetical protein
VPAFAGVECLHEVFCFSSHDGSPDFLERDAAVDSCRRMRAETNYRRTMTTLAISRVRTIGSST